MPGKRSPPPGSVGVSPAEMEAKMAALPGKSGGGVNAYPVSRIDRWKNITIKLCILRVFFILIMFEFFSEFWRIKSQFTQMLILVNWVCGRMELDGGTTNIPLGIKSRLDVIF